MATVANIPLADNQLIVTLSDVSMINSIKKAISMLRGVEKVAKPRTTKRSAELDEALRDVQEGRVYHADSVDDMFKQILGEDYVLG